MTTTDQRTEGAEAFRAGREAAECVGWAVPGVDRVSPSDGGGAGGRPRPGYGVAAPIGADRGDSAASGSAESTSAAAGDALREELGEPAEGRPHPIVTALVTCVEVLDGVRGMEATSLSPREIRLMLLAVVHVISVAFAIKMRLLVAGEVQRVADLTGATSTAAFLSHLTQTKRAEASAQVRLAKDLDRRFPLLAEALEAGRVSPEQVTVCVAALRRLPKDLGVEKLEACQRFLVDAAQSMDPRQLKEVGRKLWEVVDPEGAEAKEGKDLRDEEELARARAYFRSWRNGDGSTGFRGRLPDLQADMLIKALQAFAAPRRRSNPNIATGQPDDIHHDGVGEGGNQLNGQSGDTGHGGGERPPDRGVPADEGPPGEEESPEERETGRSVPYPVKLGHALMDLVERLPADLVPNSGGVAATVVVTMRLEQLLNGLGAATLDTGTVVSAAQARRLACEAGIIPVVLGGKSEPLDVGRERRVFTKYQRHAMAVRDGGCVIEGCDRPPAWCEGHHPRAWEDGGKTSVENGVLVCAYHHRLLHDRRWRLHRRDDTWTIRRL